MDGRIRGSFPGGPGRRDPDAPPGRAPRLPTVQEMEERAARRSATSRRHGRAVRMRLGLVVALVLAFVVGAAVGLASHATREELTEAAHAAPDADREISQEVNRMLLELWKMEDVEAARNGGRIP